MKRIFLSLLLMTALTASVSAQEIYTEIRKMAQEVLSNPNANELSRKTNQFKLDALDYMAIKMREQMPDSTAAFLDSQALALYNYTNLFIATLAENKAQPAAFQVKLIELFMDASYSNPLFYDTDKTLVLAYYSDGNSFTRFSLDTDWRRAFAAATYQLKKMK